jgi:hypothetical protein
LRSPPISASIIARPETPGRPLATEAGLDPGVFQHPGQPLALADPPPDELLAVPGALPQRRHLGRRDEAGPQQPVLAQPGELPAVPQIGLAAGHSAHVRGVGHAHLDLLAGQRVIVKSAQGAVPAFRPSRFPGPLPAPAVRLSPQRALRKPRIAW